MMKAPPEFNFTSVCDGQLSKPIIFIAFITSAAIIPYSSAVIRAGSTSVFRSVEQPKTIRNIQA
mgnify:CR=1 FL=1